MQKYFYISMLTVVTVLLGTLYFYNKKIDKLNKEIVIKDEAISSIVEGYNQALEVKEIETISKVNKVQIEADTRLKTAIKKRGDIEVPNSDDNFINFTF